MAANLRVMCIFHFPPDLYGGSAPSYGQVFDATYDCCSQRYILFGMHNVAPGSTCCECGNPANGWWAKRFVRLPDVEEKEGQDADRRVLHS